MNNIQRIAKNAGVLFASQLVSYVFGFFFVMYTARYLGAEGFGVLSFALALTGIFGVFSDLGLSTLMVREVARDKSLAEKYIGNIMVLKLFLVIMTFGLISVTTNILRYPDQTIEVIYVVAISIVLNSFSNIFSALFQAYEKMEYVSFGQVLNGGLMLLGALFVISQEQNILGFAYIYLVVAVVIVVYNFAICALKFFLPKMKVDLNFWKTTLKVALPFGWTTVFVSIYYWIDSVMLSFIQGDEVVGWYNASYRLILVLLFIPSILSVSLFPLMSQLYVKSRETLRFSFERYFKYMAIVGIPIGVGTTLLADKFIFLVYDGGYSKSVIALQMLVWSSVFIYLSSSCARLLESTNKQIVITKITAMNALANIILNLALIPKFSYIGASFATVITELSALIFGIIACKKIGFSLPNKELLNLVKIIAASLMMGALIIYLKNFNLLVSILLAIVFYFSILYCIGGFDEEDLNMIASITHRVREENEKNNIDY